MDFEPFENKKIAILTNHTAVNRNGKHLLDLIHKANNSNVLANKKSFPKKTSKKNKKFTI